jgi:2-C-methyl-D-erythritol 2,4-cyclodiphosphate synthase
VVAERGFTVANADIVIMCEEPRVAPHRQQMRAAVSKALGIGPERVTIKGTTTEGLGFTGRGEGIMAFANVLLEE